MEDACSHVDEGELTMRVIDVIRGPIYYLHVQYVVDRRLFVNRWNRG